MTKMSGMNGITIWLLAALVFVSLAGTGAAVPSLSNSGGFERQIREGAILIPKP